MVLAKDNEIDAIALVQRFLDSIKNDGRIGPSHIGVYLALLYTNDFKGPDTQVKVFSRDVMAVAKIASKYTYRTCLRDLERYGYIEYRPSYKKNMGSSIYLKALGARN